MEFNKEELVKSPLNFTGGKFKLLPQILPLFPDKIETFVDLFCGGLDVSLNIEAKNIISNDIILPMVNMYKYLKNTDSQVILNDIDENIINYNLTKENLEGFIKLRNDYNNSKENKLLLPLIFYCYNNQIRFNSNWGFNRHFGKDRSSFNDKIKNNLILTLLKIHNKNITFKSEDVFEIDYNKFNNDMFVYADPPYLITQADYSIQASWNEEKENKLLSILDNLHKKGVKFALSNVLEHKDKSNDILKEWSKQYNVHHLNIDYSNCNASNSSKKHKSDEVLITNYK
jgi:DNA adenine methylase Dam